MQKYQCLKSETESLPPKPIENFFATETESQPPKPKPIPKNFATETENRHTENR